MRIFYNKACKRIAAFCTRIKGWCKRVKGDRGRCVARGVFFDSDCILIRCPVRIKRNVGGVSVNRASRYLIAAVFCCPPAREGITRFGCGWKRANVNKLAVLRF